MSHSAKMHGWERLPPGRSDFRPRIHGPAPASAPLERTCGGPHLKDEPTTHQAHRMRGGEQCPEPRWGREPISPSRSARCSRATARHRPPPAGEYADLETMGARKDEY